jgi:hypothetical protein
LTESAAPGARRLAKLVKNLRQTGFHENFMSLLYNTTGAINGYDQYGHYLRALLLSISACTNLLFFEADFCLAHFNEAAQGEITTDPTPKAPSPTKTELEDVKALQRFAKSDPAAYREALDLQAQAPAQASSGRPPSLAAVRSLLDTMIGRQPSNGGGR